MAVLAALDVVFLPLPAAASARALVVVAVIMAEAGLVWLVGERYVGTPLREGVRALEKIAADAGAQRQHAEQLASAGRLAAGIAHEIGNPLCAITNYAHRLEERVPPELRETVHSLQREAIRIERITDGFIDHARPREPGAVGAEVNHAIETVLGFLGEQGVIRRIDIDRQVDDQPLPVAATALELEQTFTNLVLNAADAMAGAGHLTIYARRVPRAALIDGSMSRAADRAITPPVGTAAPAPPRSRNERLHQWVAARSDAFVVKVVFADSGHGVRRGDEDRIFEPFVTTKPSERGSGLGLSVVRRLVDSMSGLVWVQPSREGGAAFHLVLPVHAGETR
jgi:signal transduction histidine kinase